MAIKASNPKCGYAVGTEITYKARDDESRSFYLIQKYNPPKKTYYCGTPQLQSYDAQYFNVAAGLPDGRILIAEIDKSQAIAFDKVPSHIVALGDDAWLVPADLLRPQLDAAGANQIARYRALVATLKSSKPVVIQAINVK